jgi:hypothetical protein
MIPTNPVWLNTLAQVFPNSNKAEGGAHLLLWIGLGWVHEVDENLQRGSLRHGGRGHPCTATACC